MECVWRAVMLLSVYKAVQLGNETSLWVLLTGMVLLQAQFLQIKKKSWVSNKNMLLCPPTGSSKPISYFKKQTKNETPTKESQLAKETQSHKTKWPKQTNQTQTNK